MDIQVTTELVRQNAQKKSMKETEESLAATKASIIVVHGKVLDKIGFEVAQKANKSAELRLTKTLNTLEIMAVKEQAKYRKEKYFLESQLEKLHGYRIQLKRDKLKKRLTADDLLQSQDTIMEILKPIDPDQMVSAITRNTNNTTENQKNCPSAVSRNTWESGKPVETPGTKQSGQTTNRTPGRSFRQLRRGMTQPSLSFILDDKEIHKVNNRNIILPDVDTKHFMTGNLNDESASYSRRSSFQRPSSSTTPRRQGTAINNSRRVPPLLSVRSQSASHLLNLRARRSLSDTTPPTVAMVDVGRRVTVSVGSADSDMDVSFEESVNSNGSDDVAEDNRKQKSHVLSKCRRRGFMKVGGEWVPPEKDELLQGLREEKKFLQRRIDSFLQTTNPK